MTHDVAAITKGLREAQKRCVLAFVGEFYWRTDMQGMVVEDLGLAFPVFDRASKSLGHRLNDKGLAVRAHLQAMNETSPAPTEQED